MLHWSRTLDFQAIFQPEGEQKHAITPNFVHTHTHMISTCKKVAESNIFSSIFEEAITFSTVDFGGLVSRHSWLFYGKA